jgi:methyl coenzyme M reductase gamma subunit
MALRELNDGFQLRRLVIALKKITVAPARGAAADLLEERLFRSGLLFQALEDFVENRNVGIVLLEKKIVGSPI